MPTKKIADYRHLVPLYGDGPIIKTMTLYVVSGFSKAQAPPSLSFYNLLCFISYPVRIIMRFDQSIRTIGWITTFSCQIVFFFLLAMLTPTGAQFVSGNILFTYYLFLSMFHIIRGYLKPKEHRESNYRGTSVLYLVAQHLNRKNLPAKDDYKWVKYESILLIGLGLIYSLIGDPSSLLYISFGATYWITEWYERVLLKRPHGI